jgi:leucyl aminopeptidase
MVTKTAVALLVAACPFVLSAPLASSGSELRLIKVSEDDAGQWVTEQEKFDKFISKNIGFIDITDIEVSIMQCNSPLVNHDRYFVINTGIQDDEVLSILSTPSSDASLSTRAVTYPTRVEHVEEAQSLIAKVSTSGPQSWLTTFTQCVL